MSDKNDNLLHCTLSVTREEDIPSRRSFLRRLPGYVVRIVIATLGMCLVAFASIIALPLVPLDRWHRRHNLRLRQKAVQPHRDTVPSVSKGEPSVW